jgi:hypothetical protein
VTLSGIGPAAGHAERLSPELRRFRALLVAACLGMAWWVVWIFDPHNLAGPGVFAVVVAGQAMDLVAVLGFWDAVWPQPLRPLPCGAVAGRAAILVLAGDQPIDVVERTLQAARQVRRRGRVLLANPSPRPELRWLPAYYGARWLRAGIEDLDQQARGRFLAVFQAGQLPAPDFLERLLPCFADRRLALVQASCSLRPSSDHVRDAVLQAGDVLGAAPCLGSNYVARRSALRSLPGGFRPGRLARRGALRLPAALRARGWGTRYVNEQLAHRAGSGRSSGFGGRARLAAAELAVALRPGSPPVGLSLSARLYAAWLGLRHLAVPGLLLTAGGLGATAAMARTSAGWTLTLALHALPYLVLRMVVLLTLPEARPPERVSSGPDPRGPHRREEALEATGRR